VSPETLMGPPLPGDGERTVAHVGAVDHGASV
jgi:hypothetical protein